MTDKEVYDLLIRADDGYVPKNREIEELNKIKSVKWEFIDTLPKSICLLIGLTKLDLSGSKITKLPDFIANLNCLQNLALGGAGIKELPEWIGKMTNLQLLDLRNTEIRELPNLIGNLINLQYLDLSNTHIKFLPDSIGRLGNLKSFCLNRTSISALPESIGNLGNLQRLYLDGTRISFLPDSIGNLGNLLKFGLYHSNISVLPESVGKLVRLQSLNISGTKINKLPESIGNLSSLRKLDLSSTRISILPESIGNLGNLQSLYLNRTSLSILPESIGNLGSLQNFTLRGTNISELSESIGNLKCLQKLNLNGTSISALPNSIGNLSSLRILGLGGTRIRTLPESIGKLESLQSLNLSGRRIQVSSLPESIGNLSNLYNLDLSSSQISSLPESIGDLNNLQKLGLSSAKICALPESIGKLGRLQSLDLRGTNISVLPKSIGNLSRLQILDLRGTNISELPESIGNLGRLQSLDLRGTNISVLPKSVGKLRTLQSLALSNNISSLPESIGNLGGMQSLDLKGTRISGLPESIKDLNNLQKLYLNGTRISTLPKGIINLRKLQILNLSGSRIKALPENIDNMSNLQMLYLSGTSINSLPESIGKLENLQILDLSSTNISELPKTLLLLNLEFVNDYSRKKGIIIKELMLQKQPVSLFLQDMSLIQKYYVSDKLELKESKIIFMGDGGAGKSYTIQRIMNDGNVLDTDTDVTHDIAIEHWDNSNKIVDFEGSIDFWDFGGQDIYLSMHRCFMTDRSCYVIVLCNRQYGSQRGLMRQARYWLKNISDHAKDSPILLAVNTWKGQLRDGISLSQLKREFPGLNIVDQIVYDAHDPDSTEFNRLTARICRMAQNHFSFSLQFPVSWNNIRTRLRQDYSKENYISEEEYYKICREELEKNDGYYDEGIAKWLLRWFNDLGYCFNYHDIDGKTDGEEYQVMKPQWVIRAMYKIINYKISYSPDPDRPAADTLAQSLADNWDPQEGVVPKKTIISLLTKKAGDENPYTDQEAEYILRILQKYRLAYLIKRSRESLFIPALCSDIRPEDFDDIGSEKILKTEYVVRFRHLPETLMQHLLITCYQKGRIPDKVWQNGFHLYGDDADQDLIIAEVIGDTEISIKYYVSKESRDFLSLHKVRSWLKDIYTELGIENVRDFIILRTENQTAYISVKALINAYRDDPELDKYYVQDDDIYQAYSVDELLTGLYGHDYRTVLGLSGKSVKEKAPIKNDTAAYSESYINIEISRDLKIIISQLREIADKKAPLDNETAAVLANKITASIDHHNNDTITENVRLQELIKDLKEAQEENDKEKMQNLLSDSANLTTVLSALTAFARYAGTLL